MGQLDDSAYWCERAETLATARGEWLAMLFVWDVLGQRRLREGVSAQASEMFIRLEDTVNRMGIGEPCYPPWARHAISAHVAAGRLGNAQRVVDWLERHAQELPCRYPRIAYATGMAALAEARGDRDEAEARFRAAMALHHEVDLPIEHVETLIGYGTFLRRSGRPARARPLLAEAVTVAEASGATWLADLARSELQVAGGRLRRRAVPPGALTHQVRSPRRKHELWTWSARAPPTRRSRVSCASR
jgi:hypothetical protein